MHYRETKYGFEWEKNMTKKYAGERSALYAGGNGRWRFAAFRKGSEQ